MDEFDILGEIGLRIKSIRTTKHISQKDFAFMCDFEKASMSRIESGKTNMSILTLIRICDALGLTLKDFFNWDI